MKVRKFGLLAVVAAVAAVPVSADADSPRDRATGGGQVLLDPNATPTQGALDTVAFTAQREKGETDDSGLADGQVQVNRRQGDSPLKFHGVVECLIVFGSKSAGKAYISGYQRGTQTAENPEGVPFELYVVDGGSGEMERGADQILLWHGEETSQNEPDEEFPENMPTGPPEDEFCGIEEDPTSKYDSVPVQARGNTQVYDANPAAPAAAAPASSKSLSLSALR
jgi:hypothetical protein